MNMIDITKIAPPKRSVSDLNYEADLRVVLEPFLSELLDMAESAGWDRRKAAYTIMFLAAQNVTERRPGADNDVSPT